jgi:hypothetical protein
MVGTCTNYSLMLCCVFCENQKVGNRDISLVCEQSCKDSSFRRRSEETLLLIFQLDPYCNL